ncbi:MAG: DUF481 domain-containing protein [Gammaproteobacteria bacterium]|nr:DUF481 domain-containing protein [Gammaproteobacteria bacterium]
MKNRVFLVAICLCLLCFSMPALAAKTDIIILNNGDHVTGEIKGMTAGQLELSTEYMDTVYIDWENIRDIISDQGHRIEMSDGRRLLGTLDKPQSNDPEKADLLIINTDEDSLEVSSSNLVKMYPVGGGFWDRMDLSFNLGFNFDKSSSVGKYNFGIDSAYRAPDFVTFGYLSSEITTQEIVDNTTRNVLSVDHMTYRPNKRYLNYFGSMEQNDQLGVELRTLVGAGYGFVPISNGRNWLSLGIGLAANRERPLDGSDSTNNLEAVGSFRYQYYKRGTPERTVDINWKIFPSLTQWGRIRTDFTASAHWEIVRDFYIGLELYTSYDGEVTAYDTAELDYGYRTLIGLKF